MTPTSKAPDVITSPPKTAVPLVEVPLESIAPDTKKLLSTPDKLLLFPKIELEVAPKDPVIPTLPENCDPVNVATTLSSMFRVTPPLEPPPVRPVPAVTEVMSPSVPSFVIVIEPLEAEVTVIPAPATM